MIRVPLSRYFAFLAAIQASKGIASLEVSATLHRLRYHCAAYAVFFLLDQNQIWQWFCPARGSLLLPRVYQQVPSQLFN